MTNLKNINFMSQSRFNGLSELATDEIYAVEMDDIVTTVAKNKAQNGYYKLGNGLIIQWGAATPSNSVATITLPTAFSSANYGVSFMCRDQGGGAGAHSITLKGDASLKTATKFEIQTRSGSGGTGNIPFWWIAAGY